MLRHDPPLPQPAPLPGEPPLGWGSRTGINPRHGPVSFASIIPRVGSGSGAGESGSCYSLAAGQALPVARRQMMGRPRDAQTPQPYHAAPRQLKPGHFLHLTPAARTFLPVREGVMGHHVDPLPGKPSEPTAAPAELAVPPEPTASPFLLFSFFLSVLSPLCLL